MSILAAGAALSLIAGGGAAKLALVPLDAALAGHQQATAQEAPAQQPAMSIADQPAAETVAWRTEPPLAADDPWDAKPVAMAARDDGPSLIAAVDDGAASDPDSPATASDAASQVDTESAPVVSSDPAREATPASAIEPASDSPPAELADPPRQDPEG
ncbi:MAG: hypothetical protein ABI306_00740 [Caulobacteraceae bacterium]